MTKNGGVSDGNHDTTTTNNNNNNVGWGDPRLYRPGIGHGKYTLAPPATAM